MKHWSDLSEKEQREIEKQYAQGKEPGEIAPAYGLKPKQISDQAYRKKWTRPGMARKKATVKNAVKKKKKTDSKKKAGKKKAAKKKKTSKKKAAKKKTAKKKATKKRR